MRYTTDATLAMKRMAEFLGWEIESSGRSWKITDAPVDEDLYEGMTFDRMSLACMFARIIASNEGVSLDEVAGLPEINWQHRYVRLPKMGKWVPDTNGLQATEEATIHRMFPPTEDIPYADA